MKGLMMRQAVAVLDAATTMLCLRVAGQVRPLTTPFETVAGPQMDPPFHWGCRTTVVPWVPGVVSDQKKVANAEIQRRPPGERRFGPDGYEGPVPGVPPKTATLPDLLRKPPAHVTDALGEDFAWLLAVTGDDAPDLLRHARTAWYASGDARAAALAALQKMKAAGKRKRGPAKKATAKKATPKRRGKT